MHVPAVFVLVVYLSGYVFLVFAAICLACGLYYLAELAEENTSLAKKLLQWGSLAEIALQLLLWVAERFPWLPVVTTIAAHAVYLGLLDKFPFIEPTSPPFVLACLLFLGSNYFWFRYFTTTREFFYQYRLAPVPSVASYFFFALWIVPIGLFVSLTINDSVLPGAGTDAPRSGGLSADAKRKRTNLVAGAAKVLVHYGQRLWTAVTGRKPRRKAGNMDLHDHDW